MLINFIYAFLFIFLSIIIFLINNHIILGSIVLFLILYCIFKKVHLTFGKPFIILLIINLIFNYLLSDINNTLIVTFRLLIMFLSINIIVKQVGTSNISYFFGYLFNSDSITIMLAITFSFIPLLIKEIEEIKKSLMIKNYPLNFINVLKNPKVFLVSFMSNLFNRSKELENVLIVRGFEE